jgi:hypothetical protein
VFVIAQIPMLRVAYFGELSVEGFCSIFQKNRVAETAAISLSSVINTSTGMVGFISFHAKLLPHQHTKCDAVTGYFAI